MDYSFIRFNTSTGYAPLQGAKVKAFKDANGGLTSVVGIATSSDLIWYSNCAYDNITGIITVTTDIVMDLV